jgi:hypothetical protein
MILEQLCIRQKSTVPPGQRVSGIAEFGKIMESFMGHQASKTPANFAGEV